MPIRPPKRRRSRFFAPIPPRIRRASCFLAARLLKYEKSALAATVFPRPSSSSFFFPTFATVAFTKTSQLPPASPNPASDFTWKPNETGLTLVKLKNRVPCVVVPSEVDGVLFSADGRRLVRYPQGRTDEKYVVPDGVVEIGPARFSNAKL